MRRPATDGPRLQVSPRLDMVPARQRGSTRPVMAGRRHPRIMGGRGRPESRPAATTGQAHPESRHLAGPAARVRRRAVSDVPVHRATGPAATHAPSQAKCPVTPGPLRRARQPLVRDGERTPARAGGVTRRLPHADRTMPGAITAGAMRADASRARGGAGGPQYPVRSPAGRVILMPTVIPGVGQGLRPTRHPIVAGDAGVNLRYRRAGRCRVVVRFRLVGRYRRGVRFRPVSQGRRSVRFGPVGRAWTVT